jgi:hypothetical protein
MMTVPGELSRVSTLVDIAGRRIFSNIFLNGGGMVLLPVGGGYLEVFSEGFFDMVLAYV